MPRLHRLVVASALSAVVAAPLLLAAPAQAANGPDLSGLSYVALGDSYASGMGLPLGPTQPAAGCFQSDQDYPHLLAAQFGLALDDRSCAGAKTANVTSTPQTTAGGLGVAPVQMDSLGASTALVTLTIGGNDLGFAPVAASCLAVSAAGPLLMSPGGTAQADCRSLYVQKTPNGEVDTLRQSIDQLVGPSLESTLAQITARAPKAVIVVVGYPALAPDPADTPAGGCFRGALASSPGAFPSDAYPFTDVDTAYLFQTQSHLDAVMANAVQKAGGVYVPALAGSVAHSPCAQTDRYVNGVTLTSAGAPNSTPIPNTPVAVVAGSLHPTAAGVAFLAHEAVEAVGLAFAGPAPQPGVSPAPSGSVSPSPTTTPTPAVSETPTASGRSGQLAATGSAPVVPGLLVGVAVLALGALTLIERRRRAHR